MLIAKEQLIGDNRMAKQDKINLFESLLMSTGRAGMDKVIEYLRKTDFYSAPASAKYHSNYACLSSKSNYYYIWLWWWKKF